MTPRLVSKKVQSGPGVLDAQQGHEVDLAAAGILARRLADYARLALDVQQVIDDLVGQPKVVGEGQEGVSFRIARMGHDEGQFEGCRDQGARLEPLHPGDSPEVLALARQIDHLASAHAPGA